MGNNITWGKLPFLCLKELKLILRVWNYLPDHGQQIITATLVMASVCGACPTCQSCAPGSHTFSIKCSPKLFKVPHVYPYFTDEQMEEMDFKPKSL